MKEPTPQIPKRSLEQTYTIASRRLHFLMESINSQVASYELRKTMGRYIAYKAAIDRLETAVSESGTQGYMQMLEEAQKNAKKIHEKICEAIYLGEMNVASLSEPAREEIIRELDLFSYLIKIQYMPAPLITESQPNE